MEPTTPPRASVASTLVGWVPAIAVALLVAFGLNLVAGGGASEVATEPDDSTTTTVVGVDDEVPAAIEATAPGLLPGEGADGAVTEDLEGATAIEVTGPVDPDIGSDGTVETGDDVVVSETLPPAVAVDRDAAVTTAAPRSSAPPATRPERSAAPAMPSGDRSRSTTADDDGVGLGSSATGIIVLVAAGIGLAVLFRRSSPAR